MTDSTSKQHARKVLWEACEPLRAEGIHIARYIEQITSLLFLKAASESPILDEQRQALEEDALDKVDWERLVAIANNKENVDDVTKHYGDILHELQNDGPFFSEIFQGINNEFDKDVNFKEVVKKVDELELWNDSETQTGYDAAGTAYEELLQRYADEAQGAGQYFTPRPLINTIVSVVDPHFGEKIHDPAAGTGGFLVGAYNHIYNNTNKFSTYESGENEGQLIPTEEKTKFREEYLTGVELVSETRRLGAMNMVLHGLNPSKAYYQGDSLQGAMYGSGGLPETFDKIVANPPFGSKYNNPSVAHNWVTETKNIEFLFVQQIMHRLADGGEAGVIVPEGVLFNQSAKSIREELLNYYNLHTVLVLPENTFHPYAGVDANVLFFEQEEGGTEEVWYYDLRSGIEGIKESNELTDDHFEEFIENYAFGDRENVDRFFSVDADTIEENNYDLNFKSYKEFSAVEDYRDPGVVLSELRETTEKIDSELDSLEELLADEGGAV